MIVYDAHTSKIGRYSNVECCNFIGTGSCLSENIPNLHYKDIRLLTVSTKRHNIQYSAYYLKEQDAFTHTGAKLDT